MKVVLINFLVFNMMKKITFIFILLAIINSSSLSADPLTTFFKTEGLKSTDDVEIVLLAANDCINCIGSLNFFDPILSGRQHYYMLIRNVSPNKIKYYTSEVLKLNKSSAKFIVNDSLYNFLSLTGYSGGASSLILLHGKNIYLNKTLGNASIDYSDKEFNYNAEPSDSMILKENLKPLNARSFDVYQFGINNFIFNDRDFRNIILYDLEGNQKGILKTNSNLVKDIYVKVNAPDTDWVHAKQTLQKIEQYVPICTYKQFYKVENYFYILAEVRVPIKHVPDKLDTLEHTVNKPVIEISKQIVLLKYDSTLKLSSYTLVKPPKAYVINSSSGFIILKDTLFINLSGKGNSKGRGSFFGLYNLQGTAADFVKIDSFPCGFGREKYYDMTNRLYYSEASLEPFAIFKYIKSCYGLYNKKMKSIAGFKNYPNDTDVEKDPKFRSLYFFNSLNSRYNSFVMRDSGFYLVRNFDKQGKITREIRLFERQPFIKEAQFFNDEKYLYAIASSGSVVKQYRFTLSDLQ